MNKQITVYVPVGQRGAGKSTYVGKLVTQQPEMRLVSRDDILMKAFGKIECDHYSGNLEYGEEKVWQAVEQICTAENRAKLILDHWCWTSRDRQHLIQKLRELGVTAVIALYFKTPLELVNQWFWLKPEVARSSEMKKIGFKKGFTFYLEDAPAQDYMNFHSHAKTISTDGFDRVIEVDPTTDLITL